MKKFFNLLLVAFFIGGIIGMLLPMELGPSHEIRAMAEIWMAGHIMIFFLGSHLFYSLKPDFSNHPLPIQTICLVVGALFNGIVIESLQSLMPGRFPTVKDILANITGVLLFLSLKNRKNPTRFFPLHALAASITIFLLWPMGLAILDNLIARHQFPLLASFETPLETTRFKADPGRLRVAKKYAFKGNRSLKVNLTTETYSGFSLAYMPADWRNYSYLQFAVYNPNPETVILNTRIHDTHHITAGMKHSDRFNSSFPLLPQEWTTVKITLEEVKKAPKGRNMDMSKISSAGFYVT